MKLQIFGRKKCKTTQKAQRFFKERRMDFQFIDLNQKAMSKGELMSVASLCGADKLIDKESKAYKKGGYEYRDYDPIEEVLEKPELLKTPIMRMGNSACIKGGAKDWKWFLD